jgi:6-pyruvoyltetrahydropterin/6-carboxytetrahydropterin synthase
MYRLKIIDSFSAGHQLKCYRGKCERVHGHNFRVEVIVEGNTLDRAGLLMDFKDLKKRLAAILDELDHQMLNQLPPFKKTNPSSENLAAHIFRDLAARLPKKLKLLEVWVWESENAGACYRPD